MARTAVAAAACVPGTPFPLLGLGTYQIKSLDGIRQSVTAALAAGYTKIDTAAVYRNEAHLASVLHELQASVPRESLFLTTKLAPKDLGSADDVYHAALHSVAALDTPYVDLFLIHWPARAGLPIDSAEHAALRLSAWRGLERLHDEGKARAIGVSNFTIAHLTVRDQWA